MISAALCELREAVKFYATKSLLYRFRINKRLIILSTLTSGKLFTEMKTYIELYSPWNGSRKKFWNSSAERVGFYFIQSLIIPHNWPEQMARIC